jgi:hypothetical protein
MHQIRQRRGTDLGLAVKEILCFALPGNVTPRFVVLVLDLKKCLKKNWDEKDTLADWRQAG